MELDFASQFVIVTFSGRTNYDGYVFCASSWSRTDHEVTIQVHLIQQPTMAPIQASYYDIFQIAKANEIWQGEFNFQLYQTKHEIYTNSYGRDISYAQSVEIVAQTVVDFK